jgi:uncharacterized protein HemX
VIRAALGFVTGGSATRLAATLLAGVALGGWAVWQVQAWRHDSQRTQAIEQQARDTVRQVENRDRASTTYQTGEAHADKTHNEIRERVRVINAQPAAAGQCLDDDGLRELGAAIDNGAPPAAGPGSTVPATGPAD